MYAENVRSNIPKNRVYIRQDPTPSPCDRKIVDLHYHDEIELLQVISGEFTCIAEGERYTARAGEVIFIRSGVPHATECLAGTRISLVQFKESAFMDTEIRRIIRYSLKLRDLSEDPVRIIRSAELFDEINYMLKEQAAEDRAYEIFIKASVIKIIGILYRLCILSDAEQIYESEKTEKVLPILSYINDNYKYPITLAEASAVLGFDQSYFCRIFKSAIGTTFTEYVNFVRVCKAEKLLGKTGMSILEISSDIGFSSVSYFNRVFKKYRNCSPSHYRRAKYCNNI